MTDAKRRQAPSLTRRIAHAEFASNGEDWKAFVNTEALGFGVNF